MINYETFWINVFFLTSLFSNLYLFSPQSDFSLALLIVLSCNIRLNSSLLHPVFFFALNLLPQQHSRPDCFCLGRKTGY